MDEAEATEALIPNVRLKYQTCNVTNYKTKHMSLTNAEKQNQNIPLAIAMKELLCFGSSKLSLSLCRWCIRQKLKEVSPRTKHVLYIGILPSRIHVVAITTN